MANTARSAPDKRTQLVDAAMVLLHTQGLHRTTLADVATRADVPLGNIYYYFKTKEALAEAVIEAHVASLLARFAAFSSAHSEPKARLRSFVRVPLDEGEPVIQFGCPHGSLCQELEKLDADAPLARAARRLLAVYIAWAEEQFRAHGIGKHEASALATDLVGAMQGAVLLAHTMRSKQLLKSQLRRIEQWLESSLSAKPRKKRSRA